MLRRGDEVKPVADDGLTADLWRQRAEGQVKRRVCLGAEHVVVAGGDRRGVHFELIARQRGVEPRHQDGVDGVPLQKHRRQAEGQGVVGAEAFQRRAGVEDAAVEVFRMGQQGAACLGEGHLRRRAAEQCGVQLLFEAAYLVAQGGLGAVEFPRGGGEIQRPAHGEKAEKLVLVHDKNSFPAAGHPYSLSIAGNRALIKLFYQDA